MLSSGIYALIKWASFCHLFLMIPITRKIWKKIKFCQCFTQVNALREHSIPKVSIRGPWVGTYIGNILQGEIYAKHSEKFESVFGGQLICMNIAPWKEKRSYANS